MCFSCTFVQRLRLNFWNVCELNVNFFHISDRYSSTCKCARKRVCNAWVPRCASVNELVSDCSVFRCSGGDWILGKNYWFQKPSHFFIPTLLSFYTVFLPLLARPTIIASSFTYSFSLFLFLSFFIRPPYFIFKIYWTGWNLFARVCL